MMDILLKPAPLRGELAAPPSKSHVQRLLLCAALADGETRIPLRAPFSSDIAACLRALPVLGAAVRETADGATVVPRALPPAETLDCGESGAVLRLALPAACAGRGGGFSVTGGGRLPQRPLQPLLAALEAGGMRFSGEKLPFFVNGELKKYDFILPGNISSQFVSGMLLALPQLAGESRLRLSSPLGSRGYVDMTLAALELFGVRVRETADGWTAAGRQIFRSPGFAAPEGDWSSAAFWLAAGALGGEVTVRGLYTRSFQPDRAVTELLRRLGAEVRESADGISVRRGELRPFELDADPCPDLAPVCAALMAAAGGGRITGGARLRYKESDRLASMAAALRAAGAQVRETADGLEIGGGLRGGEIDCGGDHRIAMAMAAVSAACPQGLVLRGADCANKSYPSFFDDFRLLGGEADVL